MFDFMFLNTNQSMIKSNKMHYILSLNSYAIGLALLRKILKFDYRDSWGYVEFSKDSESGLGIVLAQKTKKLGASKASASTLQRLKN